MDFINGQKEREKETTLSRKVVKRFLRDALSHKTINHELACRRHLLDAKILKKLMELKMIIKN